MTAVGKQTALVRASRPRRDYAVAIAMLVEGHDPVEVHKCTGLRVRDLTALWHAIDGEASGTMRRFGSVIHPRYRPRSEPLDVRPPWTPVKVHWSTR
jgi:hypothetical protein